MSSSAWWQWRQACGDPHSVNNPEHTTGDQTHLNAVGCPGDVEKGLTKEFATVLSRAYPRAAPGTISQLVNDLDTGAFTLVGIGPKGGQLVVWVPDAGRGEPKPVGDGLREISVAAVRGGWYVTATTDCTYRLYLGVAAAPPTKGTEPPC